MKFYAPFAVLGFSTCIASAKAYFARAPRPTLYVAGDSTAAKDDGNVALLGWGEKIEQYLSIPVVNNAISGATARSFTEGGNCESINPVIIWTECLTGLGSVDVGGSHGYCECGETG